MNRCLLTAMVGKRAEPGDPIQRFPESPIRIRINDTKILTVHNYYMQLLSAKHSVGGHG